MSKADKSDVVAVKLPLVRESLDGKIDDMTLAEAAVHTGIPLPRLRRLAQTGAVAGYKVNGSRGPEWRVTASAAREAGCEPAPVTGPTTRSAGGQDTALHHLRQQVQQLTEALTAERARADDRPTAGVRPTDRRAAARTATSERPAARQRLHSGPDSVTRQLHAVAPGAQRSQ